MEDDVSKKSKADKIGAIEWWLIVALGTIIIFSGAAASKMDTIVPTGGISIRH